jgi:hypothetical protein
LGQIGFRFQMRGEPIALDAIFFNPCAYFSDAALQRIA